MREGTVRLTGLFPTRRKGMWTGNMRADEIRQLAALTDKAERDGKNLTVILFENEKDGKADFGVYVGEAREFPSREPAPATPAPRRAERERGVPADPAPRRSVRRSEVVAAGDLPF